jgi:hypothetical protein
MVVGSAHGLETGAAKGQEMGKLRRDVLHEIGLIFLKRSYFCEFA